MGFSLTLVGKLVIGIILVSISECSISINYAQSDLFIPANDYIQISYNSFDIGKKMDYNPGELNVNYTIFKQINDQNIYTNYDLLFFPNGSSPSYLCYINVTSLDLWNATCNLKILDCNRNQTFSNITLNISSDEAVSFSNCNASNNFTIGYTSNLKVSNNQNQTGILIIDNTPFPSSSLQPNGYISLAANYSILIKPETNYKNLTTIIGISMGIMFVFLSIVLSIFVFQYKTAKDLNKKLKKEAVNLSRTSTRYRKTLKDGLRDDDEQMQQN